MIEDAQSVAMFDKIKSPASFVSVSWRGHHGHPAKGGNLTALSDAGSLPASTIDSGPR